MIIKKSILAVVLVGAILIMAGCGCFGPYPYNTPPAGTSPIAVVSSVNYPSAQNAMTVYNLNSSDIEILGPVEVSTSSMRILLLVSWGDNSYGELLKEAKEVYPETEALINVYTDTDCTSVLFSVIYQKVTTRMTGTAIKFKK